MKKKFFLIVLIIAISSVTAFAIWQWDNIVAVVDGIRYDDEQIARKAESSVQSIEKYFEENNLDKVTPMTPEQEEALQNGEITVEEAIKIMTGKLTLEEAKNNDDSVGNRPASSKDGDESERDSDTSAEDNNDKSDGKSASSTPKEDKGNNVTGEAHLKDNTENKSASDNTKESAGKSKDNKQSVREEKEETDSSTPKGSTPPEKQPPTDKAESDNSKTNQSAGDNSYDALISAKVAELYVVKSNFYSRFNSRYAQVRSEFLSRPVSERTRANLTAVVKSYMSEGLAMERECDAQVEAILSELSGLLRNAGRDQSLVDSIRSAYNSEKSALKSSLINKYF